MPEIHLEDTIAAISTPPGEGGIGIVRLSGKNAIAIAACMFRSLNETNLAEVKSHTVHFGTVCDGEGRVIDQVLVTVFRKPKSYTAEDVVEISAHGGSRVLQRILNLALSYGARHAEPGEFTKRAFLNGRIDLAQAEAVLDLIRSRSDRSLEVALRQLAGKLSEEIHSIKDELVKIYAHLEAYLDFPDEHLEVYSNREFKSHFESVMQKLERLIGTFSKGSILREGALVVIIGRPNVGKSSLLNAFLDRDRAIVSEIPGTTRDILEESISLNGLWIRLLDTAGLGQSQNPLDQAAMERTRRSIGEGDLFLWVLDATSGLTDEDQEIVKGLKQGKKVIPVVNKIDIANRRNGFESFQKFDIDEAAIFLSAKTGEGIETLEKKMTDLILKHELNEESTLITRARHKRSLEESLEALRKSFDSFTRQESLEFVVLDLKQALDRLREFVGEIYSEDLLDMIFKEFCIGK
ncbi:MAG: tRNA uridine-5-carboxymethylaminomethyl(34) synthesis GTPase MnmE [Candidatus Omnitrophica bacterium]|nr:tRNA uridine-5-carboxymethylaminomethyl(34) synthesis GTPase MnmE [Candidatus Omnitrophota bacterium]